MIPFQNHIILHSTSVREALVLLNDLIDTLMVLFVVDDAQRLVGTITDGDIRRALIGNATMDSKVHEVMYQSFRFAQAQQFSLAKFHSYKKAGVTLLPVLDAEGRIINIRNLIQLRSILPVDAVIMAGGEGQRLRPLTEKTPKPLLKVGDKPIIEHNLDRLAIYGVYHIHITLRYLGEQIEQYFGDGVSKSLRINYVTERDALGTIGAVGLVPEFKNDVVLVMNSDLLTNINYEDFYNTFVEKDADMLIAAVPYNVNVPYAVLETTAGKVERFVEKPTYTYHSNAGIYLIKRELLKRIDGKLKYDATDFMQSLIQEGRNVQTYPLLDFWLDIGRHEEYEKAQEAVKHMNL